MTETTDGRDARRIRYLGSLALSLAREVDRLAGRIALLEGKRRRRGTAAFACEAEVSAAIGEADPDFEAAAAHPHEPEPR